MAATVIGRAVVLVNAQMDSGAGTQIGQQLQDTIGGTQIGETVGEQIGQGAGNAGSSAGSEFGQKFKKGLNVASVGIVAGATAAVVGLNKIGDTFDAVVDTLRAGTGATGDDLEALTQVAKNVGTTTAASFDQIGPTVADLNTRLGLTGDTLQTVSSQVLEAGRVFDTELDINALSSSFSAFGIEGEKVEGAMDRLFTASQASGVGMNELAGTAAKVSPQMKALGFSFDETVGLIGNLDKAGIDAAGVASSMGKALINLAKDGEKPQEAFKRTVGEIDNMVKAGDEIGANEIAMKLFGTKGSTNFLNALKSGKININDLGTIAGETSDTILAVGADTEDFAESWQKFTNRMMVAVEPLASKVFGMIAEGFDTISPKIEAAVGWIEDNIETVKTWAIVIGVVAGSILILNAGLTAYTIIVGTVTAVTRIWAGVQWLLNTAILANPLTWIVIAIVAVVAAVVLAYTKIGWFKDGLLAIWAGITGGISAAIGWITGTAGPAIGNFFAGMGGFFTDLGSGIADFFVFIGNSIADFAGSAWGKMQELGSGIGNFFVGIGQWISSTFNSAVEGVRVGISNVISFFGNIASGIGGIFSSIGGFIGNTFRNLVGIIKGAVNLVITAINAPIRAINAIKIKVPSWVPGIGGASWGPSIPTVPSFADGGVIPASPGGKIIRVSERGQAERVMNEYEYQNQRRELQNLRKADNTNSTSGGNTFQINGYEKSPFELYQEFDRLDRWNK